jgi:hypothetical protein
MTTHPASPVRSTGFSRSLAHLAIAAALALHTGCTAVRSLGLLPEQDDLALSALTVAVQRAAVKHGLPADILTDAEIREIAAILAAQTRLDEIASAKASRADIQERAAALIDRYIIAPPRGTVPTTQPGAAPPAAQHGAGAGPSTGEGAEAAGTGWPMDVSLWRGQAAPMAARDTRVQLAVSPDGTSWTLAIDGVPSPSDGPPHWPMGIHGRAVCALWYPSVADSWQGGKFEWFRPTRNLGNVRNGYGGHVAPPRGTPVKWAVHSPDGALRSNVVDGVYP